MQGIQNNPLVLERKLQEILANGGKLQIEASCDVIMNGSNISGEWYFFAIDAETNERSVLVRREDIQPKVYKTPGGIISFLMKFEFRVVLIPLQKGELVEAGPDKEWTRITPSDS